MTKGMQPLWTFDAVIEALGGTAAVTKMTRQANSAVPNWRAKRGRFPSKYYASMKGSLARRGYYAPPELWGQVACEDPLFDDIHNDNVAA